MLALQAHLRLVQFPKGHDFIDKAKHTVGIAVNEPIAAQTLRVLVLQHQFLQRTDDKRHWGAYLMGEVDEECQFFFVIRSLSGLLESHLPIMITTPYLQDDEPNDAAQSNHTQQ